MDVTMKTIADQVVSLVRRMAAPRGPNAVWEPWPPKAPARSADLPCWRRTTPTRKRQTTTCRMTRRVTIGAALEPLCRKNDPENFLDWCGGGDLNPYALRRKHLKLVRLPISPPPRCVSTLGGARVAVNNPKISIPSSGG